MSITLLSALGNPNTEIQEADINFSDESGIPLVFEISLPSVGSQNEVAIVKSLEIYVLNLKSTRNNRT